MITARRCGRIAVGKIVETFFDCLLMEPWVHFPCAFLGAEEVLCEWAWVRDCYEGILTVVDIKFAEAAACVEIVIGRLVRVGLGEGERREEGVPSAWSIQKLWIPLEK